VDFDLPRAGQMCLKLYSVDGRCVATVEQGTLPAGEYKANLAAVRLASGVYFLRLESNGASVSRELTVVH